MQGKIINGFKLIRLLGVGGMAEVWYAENEIHLPAAVKILNDTMLNRDSIVERFRQEAEIMVKLHHPNIRQVIGYGTVDGRPAILMEYLEGKDFREYIKNGIKFTGDDLVKWWNQLVDALTYMHRRCIIHRDIKPANIFVDNDGNIKLLDFGIAKMKENLSKTKTGMMLGTLSYMSPEQVMDSKYLGPESDYYSLAVTFVHLMTGRDPYDLSTLNDYKVRRSIVEIPLNMTGVPAYWQEFLKPLLVKPPEKRGELKHFVMPSKIEKPVKKEPQKTSKILEITKTINIAKIKNLINITKIKNFRLYIILTVMLLAGIIVLLCRPNADTRAFKKCITVQDYRNYTYDYGKSGKHYNEAISIIGEYERDSTAKAVAAEKEAAIKREQEAYEKCTTIPACEEYLRAYPDGPHADAVKTKKSELELERQQIATITDNGEVETPQKPAAEPKKEKPQPSYIGVFSVSQYKKMSFAKGNLQYQPSTRKWRFANNQWDIIGDKNNNISSNYSGWIDLFGWGTGTQPTQCSEHNSVYSDFKDWGNNITNADGKRWRTLSKKEWEYVLNERTTNSGIRYVRAIVNGVNGVIILPDNWLSSYYSLSNPNNPSSDFTKNTISKNDWNKKFQANGAVFLPVGGFRDGKKCNMNNRSVYYWTNTDSDDLAYVVYLNNNVVLPINRYYGASVRLVCNAEQ